MFYTARKVSACHGVHNTEPDSIAQKGRARPAIHAEAYCALRISCDHALPNEVDITQPIDHVVRDVEVIVCDVQLQIVDVGRRRLHFGESAA